MKTRKLNKKLALNKSTISNLSNILPEGTKARIKGGNSIYPCEISAPQIICDSIDGFTCNNCGGHTDYACGTDTCGCPVSYPQIICDTFEGYSCQC